MTTEPESLSPEVARRRGACAGTGKYVAVTEDGKRVCPDCRVEIEDHVVRVPVKRQP